MRFEIDHLFICTSAGAPEAGRLIEFGLTEGKPNVHPGQGTANRRFFFRSGMLELLWLDNPEEATSEGIAPTRLYERCKYQETGASPFGLCLRPGIQGEAAFPFGCWSYRPPYLPANLKIYVADNSTIITEPMLFYSPYALGTDELPADRGQPVDHAAGFREITAVRITMPVSKPYSPALRAVGEMDWTTLRAGGEHLLEIGFDGEKQGEFADFRPELPLVFSW